MPARQDRTPGLHCTSSSRPTKPRTYSLTLLLHTTPSISLYFSFDVWWSVKTSLLSLGSCLLCKNCIAQWCGSSQQQEEEGQEEEEEEEEKEEKEGDSAKLRLAAAASSVSKQQSSTVKLRRGRELPSPIL